MNTKRIVLPGGSGFLGRILAHHLQRSGYEVAVLSHTPGRGVAGIREVGWDGEILGAWVNELEGAAAMINLDGRSVNCRYTARNRRLIMNSRVNSTRVLGQAIAQCISPPPVWLNSSTATIYRHSFDRALDEATEEISATPEAKDAFSIEVVAAWEQIFNEAPVPGTRKVALQTAMVLSNTESVFRVLRRLADFCRAIEWIMVRHDLEGAVNVAAPHPLPNRHVMRILRQTLGIPIGLAASRWMLELGAILLRTETELIIKSRRVGPGRLLASGFEFEFPELGCAARDLCGRD